MPSRENSRNAKFKCHEQGQVQVQKQCGSSGIYILWTYIYIFRNKFKVVCNFSGKILSLAVASPSEILAPQAFQDLISVCQL